MAEQKNLTELEKIAEEKYLNLQFRDDFLFCKILVKRPDLTKELLELILDTKIKKVVPQGQKHIEITADGRGVRFDVYMDDEKGTVYDLEMQTTKQSYLPKRARYYQSMIDLDLIERGAKFSALKKSYVIFICMSDPFNEGRHIYFFENICKQNPDLKLEDGTYKVFLNVNGTQDDVSHKLLDFFDLVRDGAGKSKLSREIAKEVEKARTREEWRMDYMALCLRDMDKMEEATNIERIKTIKKLINKNQSKEFIFDLDYTEEEYQQALDELNSAKQFSSLTP